MPTTIRVAIASAAARASNLCGINVQDRTDVNLIDLLPRKRSRRRKKGLYWARNITSIIGELLLTVARKRYLHPTGREACCDNISAWWHESTGDGMAKAASKGGERGLA
jgi:hypothetical protein